MSAAPTRRLRMGLVGLNFGRHIVEEQILSGPGKPWFELTTLCDFNTEKRDAMAAKHGLKTAPSYEALVNDPEIDVIGLFTGPVKRSALIRQALDAGKPVMTTKPFDLDPAAAQAVLEHAAKIGIPVHLNSPGPLLTPDQEQIIRWRDEFGLGAIIAARFETYARYREKPDGTWLDSTTLCPVAPIFRLGIYALNEMVRLVGDPESVTVQHSRLFTERPVPDNAQLSLKFRNGALGSVFASMCIDNGRHYPNTLTLHYENGTIWRNTTWPDNEAATVDSCDLHLSGGAVMEKRHVAINLGKGSMAGGYQWQAFHRACNGEALGDTVTIAQTVAGLRVIQAMAEAETSGRMVQIDLA